MQILMGVNETLIKLDERENIQHIIRFISKQFSTKTLFESQITIPYACEDHHKRLFLLKWFYSIYSRNLPHAIPALKESLIRRIEKPIRIVFSKPIHERKAIVYIRDITFDRLTIETSSNALQPFIDIRNRFSKHLLSTSYNPLSIHIKADTQESKEQIRQFLELKEISGWALELCYDEVSMQRLFSTPVSKATELEKAYALLNADAKESTKNIRRQYISLAKRFHPDTIAAADESQIDSYTVKFQMIRDAFEIIKNERSLNKVS